MAGPSIKSQASWKPEQQLQSKTTSFPMTFCWSANRLTGSGSVKLPDGTELKMRMLSKGHVFVNVTKKSDSQPVMVSAVLTLTSTVKNDWWSRMFPVMFAAVSTGTSTVKNCWLSKTFSRGIPIAIHLQEPLKILEYNTEDKCSDSQEYLLQLTVHYDEQSADFGTQQHIQKMKWLSDSRAFADCTLGTTDNHELRAHMAIMAMKSEPIRLAFERREGLQTAEAKTNVFSFDCHSSVLKLILPFFYTGEFPVLNPNNILELFRVAHLYNIDGLVEFLRNQLTLKCINWFTTDNVFEFIVFSNCDAYELASVKLAGLKFIAQNYKTVKLSPKWKEFRTAQEHSCLIDDVMATLFDQSNSVAVQNNV